MAEQPSLLSAGCYPHTCVMRQAFVQEAVLLMEPHAARSGISLSKPCQDS